MAGTVFIGGAAGFAGDRTDAAGPLAETLAGCDGPRFIMFEMLAERTLALAQLERRADPARGYNRALDRLLAPILERCREANIKIVGNFGAANPTAAGERIVALARELGIAAPRVAVVEGDDIGGVLSVPELAARETDGTVLQCGKTIVSANLYLGAAPIAQALDQGADIVVTGRVVDSALALGPLMHAFKWRAGEWERLAAGTMAGHLLECGAQVTGGYFADPGFKDVPGLADVGYPIAEVSSEGEIVVTKPRNTGGRVDRQTVIEQRRRRRRRRSSTGSTPLSAKRSATRRLPTGCWRPASSPRQARRQSWRNSRRSKRSNGRRSRPMPGSSRSDYFHSIFLTS